MTPQAKVKAHGFQRRHDAAGCEGVFAARAGARFLGLADGAFPGPGAHGDPGIAEVQTLSMAALHRVPLGKQQT
jgi:hypothetical protein